MKILNRSTLPTTKESQLIAYRKMGANGRLKVLPGGARKRLAKVLARRKEGWSGGIRQEGSQIRLDKRIEVGWRYY